MKPNIHPFYHNDAKVICACGATFISGSVLPQIHVEICSNCHPFYTGVKKYIDTEGRVQRFERKRTEAGSRTPKVKKIREASPAPRHQTLKELLQDKKSALLP